LKVPDHSKVDWFRARANSAPARANFLRGATEDYKMFLMRDRLPLSPTILLVAVLLFFTTHLTAGTTTIVDGFVTNLTTFKMGTNGPSLLQVGNGGIFTNSNATITGNSNLAQISGNGSVWLIKQLLEVGPGYSNRLEILDGAYAQCTDLHFGVPPQTGIIDLGSSILVRGSNSTFKARYASIGGGENNISLEISEGGQMVTTSADVKTVLARQLTNLNVLITGAGTRWTNSGLLSLSGNPALIRVEDGAVLQSASISGNSNSLIIVSGAESSLMSRSISAPLAVSNGAMVSLAQAPMASLSVYEGSLVEFSPSSGSVFSSGKIRIDGGILRGPALTPSGLTIEVEDGLLSLTNETATGGLGLSSSHSKLILEGGTVIVDTIRGVGNTIDLVLHGGRLEANTLDLSLVRSYVLGDGIGSGRLDLKGNSHNLPEGFTVSSNMFLNIHGAVTVSGTFDRWFTNQGALALGERPTTLTLDGALMTSPASALRFQIGGTNQGVDCDLIETTSGFRILGKIETSLVNGFTPKNSDSFTVIRSRSRAGTPTYVESDETRTRTKDGRGTFRIEADFVGLYVVVCLRDFQLDEDHDGILDEWAEHFFGHTPLTEAERLGDDDKDGVNNYEEFLARTDPHDPKSVFRVRASRESQFSLILPYIPGRLYPIRATTNFIDWEYAYPTEVRFPTPDTIELVNPGLPRTNHFEWPERLFFRVLVR
jgi:hypothetical protein